MLLYGNWLRLSLPTRQKIAQEFNITKKGPTHVVDNMVKDDGYSIHDVESALSVESMQKFLNTDEGDIEILWGRLLDRIDGKVVVTAPDLEAEIQKTVKTYEHAIRTALTQPITPKSIPSEKKKRGRPKKVK